MAAKRKSKGKGDDQTLNLLDITSKLKTAPCVPALRDAVRAWRSTGYEGTTDTTKRLLTYWFQTDHQLQGGARFAYHASQREAIETLIFVWEHQRLRTRTDLLQRYALDVADTQSWSSEPFARYAVKMATGSGKTKVIALAIAWQFLNAQRENGRAHDYARTFLILAPNVVVHERLSGDFANGRIFDTDPIVPRDMRDQWDFGFALRGDGSTANAAGKLFLTNIQQLYELGRERKPAPDPVSALLGPSATAATPSRAQFQSELVRREGNLLVINDEAHHAHSEESEWNRVIRSLHGQIAVNVQLDLSATPRFSDGTLFPWTISDYPLKQAIFDGVVKRPMRGVVAVEEVKSEHASVQYEGYLVAAVERWKEYAEQLLPLKRSPLLFVMLSNTREADDVGNWLRRKYPTELGGDHTLVIHTNASGDITKADIDKARVIARKADSETTAVRAIVSVLMLREGWDVQNVTVVVGLRPFTSRANILPEQAIGRGLRLMFRGQSPAGYQERVDIIGNDKFLEFVDELERLEEIGFDTVDLRKERVQINAIRPLPERAEFDIAIPRLSPALVRKKSLVSEIASLDVEALTIPDGFSVHIERGGPTTFKYEGFDVVTDKRELVRQYTAPQASSASELAGYYARRIAENLKLPAQFASLAPKVRDFFRFRLLPEEIELDSPEVVRFLGSAAVHQVTVEAFTRALGSIAVASAEPDVAAPSRSLSTCTPFPWSQLVVGAERTVFNLIACENEGERTLARFLDGAVDVRAFAKLPVKFGFALEYVDRSGNLRFNYPDWIVETRDRALHLIETKDSDVSTLAAKDRAALLWCESATALTDARWQYTRLTHRDFSDVLRFADLVALSATPSLDQIDLSAKARLVRRRVSNHSECLETLAQDALKVFSAARMDLQERWLKFELEGYAGVGNEPKALHDLLLTTVEHRLVMQVKSYRAQPAATEEERIAPVHFFVESIKELRDAQSRLAQLPEDANELQLSFAASQTSMSFGRDVFERILLGFRAALHLELTRLEG